MILVPAKWELDGGLWCFRCHGFNLACVWFDAKRSLWIESSGNHSTSHPTITAAKRAVEKALKARTK